LKPFQDASFPIFAGVLRSDTSIGARALVAIAIAIALAAICLITQKGFMNTSWRFDDGPHLSFVSDFSPWQYFFDSEVIRHQSWVHFTPWNAFFYEIGVQFWGLNVTGHYLHLITVIWFTSLATYALLRIWAPVIPSAMGAALYLAMPSTGVVGKMLMTGHYAYGLLFSVLALLFFSKGVIKKRRSLTAISAIFYLLACMCKELYPPLIAVFFVLPIGRFQDRLQHLLWLVLVALIYAAFRLQVFPSVESYARNPFSGNPSLLTLFNEFFETLLGSGEIGILFAALLLSTLSVTLRFSFRHINLYFVATTIAICAVPIAPMIKMGFADPPSGRLLYLISWCLAVSAPAMLKHFENTVWANRVVIICLAILVGLGAYSQQVIAKRLDNGPLEAQYKFLATQPADTFLLPYQFGNVRYLESMRNAVNVIERKAAPTILRSEADLSKVGRDSASKVFHWSADCNCMTAMQERYEAYLSSYEDSLIAGREIQLTLRVEIENRGLRKILRWKFDAGQASDFELHLIEYGKLRLPATGEIPFGLDVTGPSDEPHHFRVYAKSANAWMARSPVLSIIPSINNAVEWSGKSSPF
jgi:hypothetical protein